MKYRIMVLVPLANKNIASNVLLRSLNRTYKKLKANPDVVECGEWAMCPILRKEDEQSMFNIIFKVSENCNLLDIWEPVFTRFHSIGIFDVALYEHHM